LNPVKREVPRPPVGEDGIVRFHACALSLNSNKGIVSRNIGAIENAQGQGITTSKGIFTGVKLKNHCVRVHYTTVLNVLFQIWPFFNYTFVGMYLIGGVFI
jgi:hypothetical protein